MRVWYLNVALQRKHIGRYSNSCLRTSALTWTGFQRNDRKAPIDVTVCLLTSVFEMDGTYASLRATAEASHRGSSYGAARWRDTQPVNEACAGVVNGQIDQALRRHARFKIRPRLLPPTAPSRPASQIPQKVACFFHVRTSSRLCLYTQHRR